MSMVNKVKAMGARATMDDDDVRARLKKDHDRFRELAKQMCEGESAASRRRAMLELKPNLVGHARAEERSVYDALIAVRTAQEAHTLAREGYVEHSLADELLTRVGELDPTAEEWLAHAKVLRELLNAHIDEEESDTFAELGANFSDEELTSMGARFEREKSAIRRGEASKEQTRSGLARRSGMPAAGRTKRGAARRVPAKKSAKRAGTTRAGVPATRSARPRRNEGAQRSGSTKRRSG